MEMEMVEEVEVLLVVEERGAAVYERYVFSFNRQVEWGCISKYNRSMQYLTEEVEVHQELLEYHQLQVEQDWWRW